MHACKDHPHTVIKSSTKQMHDDIPESDCHLPTPGIGEQGVLVIPPGWTEAGRPDLSGGPPGAERGTRSVGRATVDGLTTCWGPIGTRTNTRQLTHRCSSWSLQGSSSTRRYCNWGSHRYGSQSWPSLPNLCIESEYKNL